MTLSFRLTYDDYRAANRAHQSRARKTRLVSWLLAAVVIGAVLVRLYDGNPWRFGIVVAAGLLGGAGGLTLWKTVMGWWLHREWQSNALVREPMTVEVCEAGLSFVLPSARNTVAWSAYGSFHEAPDLFLLYSSARAFHIVPKRVFASDAEMATFRELASRRIDSRSSRTAP